MNTDRHAFTLVEMVIVLTVIALIIGAVATSRTLIANAKRQAQIAQLAEFDAATAQFFDQYKSLPGDMTNGIALGLQEDNGDGNGYIENVDERTDVWFALNAAGYYTASAGNAPYSLFKEQARITMVSHVAIGHPYNNWVHVINGGVDGGYYTGGDAFWVDSKLDDGKPYTGSTIVFYDADWRAPSVGGDMEDFFDSDYDGDASDILCTDGEYSDGAAAEYDKAGTLETCGLFTRISM